MRKRGGICTVCKLAAAEPGGSAAAHGGNSGAGRDRAETFTFDCEGRLSRGVADRAGQGARAETAPLQTAADASRDAVGRSLSDKDAGTRKARNSRDSV